MSAKTVDLDHQSYKVGYRAYIENANEKDYNVIKMIKYGLLRNGDTNKRILMVGPGPALDVENYINQISNYFDEIVLVEVNPHYTASYESQQWYLDNKNKIKIYQNKIEHVEFKRNSFDIIIANHVAYYFILDDIKKAILPKFDTLLKPSGHALISVEPDWAPCTRLVLKKLKPKYGLCSFIRGCLEHDEYSFFELCTFYDIPMTTPEAKQLFRLFAVEDLYRHPDYHSGDVSKEESEKIDFFIDKEFHNLVSPQRGSDKVVLRQNTNWFVIQKRNIRARL